jgi:hypothetical protein
VTAGRVAQARDAVRIDAERGGVASHVRQRAVAVLDLVRILAAVRGQPVLDVDGDVASLGEPLGVERHAAAIDALGPRATVDDEHRGAQRGGRRRRVDVEDVGGEPDVVRDVGLHDDVGAAGENRRPHSEQVQPHG